MGLGFLNLTSQLNTVIFQVFSISLPSPFHQDNTLSLTNAATYPHCFLTAYKSLWHL